MDVGQSGQSIRLSIAHLPATLLGIPVKPIVNANIQRTTHVAETQSKEAWSR